MTAGNPRAMFVTNGPAPYRDALFEAVESGAPGRWRVLYLHDRVPGRQWTRRSDPAYDHRTARRAIAGDVGAELEAFAPDVVLIGGWGEPGCWLARRWCLRSGTPALAWAESHDGSGRRRGVVSNGLRRRFLHGLSGGIVPGQEGAAFLRRLGLSGALLEFPNPVVHPLRTAYPAPPTDEISLLFVGALETRKQPERVLDIAAVAARSGQPVRVTFAGAGSLGGSIAQRARRANVEALLAGYVEHEELEALWSSAHCLVLASKDDPAPLVLSEAAARGVPFVASSACGGAATLLALGAAGRQVTFEAGPEQWWDAARAVIGLPRVPLRDVLPEPAARRLQAYVEAQSAATPARHEGHRRRRERANH